MEKKQRKEEVATELQGVLEANIQQEAQAPAPRSPGVSIEQQIADINRGYFRRLQETDAPTDLQQSVETTVSPAPTMTLPPRQPTPPPQVVSLDQAAPPAPTMTLPTGAPTPEPLPRPDSSMDPPPAPPRPALLPTPSRGLRGAHLCCRPLA